MKTRAERRREQKRAERKLIPPCRFPLCVSSDRRFCLSEEVHWKDCPRHLADDSQSEAKEHILRIENAPILDGEQCEETGEHPNMKERFDLWSVPSVECPGCGERPVFVRETETEERYQNGKRVPNE